ncbi:hypothetical protein [Nonomuraea candida]|uniref:hypothetical protein n=1 Tax=Nonomuraea candida TaxID=359159 RepID=UPI0005BBDCF9|nr:hypothetical protein [Nonomuraea candida]
MSLFVVYVPDTGHVVGAVSALGALPPGDDAGVAALVGDALPLRVPVAGGEVASLPLPARELAVHEAEDEPRVYAGPLAFGVEQVPGGRPKPALVQLATWAEGVTLTAGSLDIKVPVPDPSQDTPVLALLAEGQDVHVLAGRIAAGTDTVRLPVSVPAGTYGVLALVTGWTGVLRAVTRS